MSQDRCPACGLPVVTIADFQAHHYAVAGDPQHVQALWTLLSIDYAALQAEDQTSAQERARERGWEIL